MFQHEGKTLVKCIEAVGGDTVYLNDQGGSFAINQEMPVVTRVYTVPKGCLVVVEDNRGNSMDSRMWEEPFLLEDTVTALLVKTLVC